MSKKTYRLGVSQDTREVYTGVVSRTGQWITRVNVHNDFLICILAVFLGRAETRLKDEFGNEYRVVVTKIEAKQEEEEG